MYVYVLVHVHTCVYICWQVGHFFNQILSSIKQEKMEKKYHEVEFSKRDCQYNINWVPFFKTQPFLFTDCSYFSESLVIYLIKVNGETHILTSDRPLNAAAFVF